MKAMISASLDEVLLADPDLNIDKTAVAHLRRKIARAANATVGNAELRAWSREMEDECK